MITLLSGEDDKFDIVGFRWLHTNFYERRDKVPMPRNVILFATDKSAQRPQPPSLLTSRFLAVSWRVRTHHGHDARWYCNHVMSKSRSKG